MSKFIIRLLSAGILLLSLSPDAFSNEKQHILYVNNITGNDSYNGLSSRVKEDNTTGPFATIKKAFDSAQTSCRIEIANTGKNYIGGNWLTVAGGTEENPLVINGNGATITGLGEVIENEWKKVNGNIYATKFWPMSNMLKGYKPIQCWIESPQIWWLNGNPGKNCKNEKELQENEGSFYWNKPKKELWFHLPAGKNFSNMKIEIPRYGSHIIITTDNVVVKNFRGIFSANDAFDTHGTGKNIVYKNCIATDNCGQGFSVHGTTTALYADCVAMRNASSGSCDVNNSMAIYRRCVFADNTFEAGVYTTEETLHIYEDCLIAWNNPFEQIWQKGGSKMNFYNCVIFGTKGDGKAIFTMEEGSLFFNQCTFADFDFLCDISQGSGFNLKIKNSIITRGGLLLKSFPDSNNKKILFANNVYYEIEGITADGISYGKDNWGNFQEKYTVDRNSNWFNPELQGKYKVNISENSQLFKMGKMYKICRVGAVLPESVWKNYSSHKDFQIHIEGEHSESK